MMQKNLKNIEILAQHGYSSESTQRDLSSEYQQDRVKWFHKNVCVLVLWTKVASALEGLNSFPTSTYNHCTLGISQCSCYLSKLFRLDKPPFSMHEHLEHTHGLMEMLISWYYINVSRRCISKPSKIYQRYLMEERLLEEYTQISLLYELVW